MAGSVRVDNRFFSMLKDLTQNDKGQKIFESYKDLVVFAANIGFQNDKKMQIEKPMGDPIKMHIFSGEYDIAIMNCIALADTEDPMLIGESQEEEKIKIFEEYACAGLDIIEKRVYKQSGDWQEHIISLILEQKKTEKNDPFDDLAKEW
jgi:dnd system-associated protein 4